MENMLGTKELYDVTLKTTFSMRIGDTFFDKGEVIAEFDEIQIANLQEIKKRVQSTGGYNNNNLVFWESTENITFEFIQGIFSKTQLSLLGNNMLYNNKNDFFVPKKEELESDEKGEISLENIPEKEELFIYLKDTNEKIEDFKINNNIIILNPELSYRNIVVRYYYKYTNNNSIIRIGTQLIPGFLKLEGKMRLKDDITGQYITGIITIPRVKIMSDLSIRLGRNASPTTTNFTCIGYPEGPKGRKKVCEIAILSDDIDYDKVNQ